MTSRPCWRIALLFLCCSVPACGGDVGTTYPVEGTIKFDGKPLDHGTVVFWPDEEAGNASPYPASSEIASDGTYALYSHGQEGAPVGAYRVVVSAQSQSDSTKPEQVKSLVPKKYTTREDTPLRIRVVEDPGDRAYDLDLK